METFLNTLFNNLNNNTMAKDIYSLWEEQPWFKFEQKAGLRRFDEKSSLAETSTAIALRALKFRLEDVMGFEITDSLFIEIFRKVCNFHPRPAFGGAAVLEFIQPLQRILERHGVSGKYLGSIAEVFRFRIDNPRYYDHLFLYIPHSSTRFPEKTENTFNYEDLNEEERLLIDYFTDELFLPDKEEERIYSIVFPFCRLYCDVERMINDPIEKKGLGISYWKSVSTGAIGHYRDYFFSVSDYMGAYLDFHAESAKKFIGKYGSRLLIDCHSFSAKPTLLNPSPSDIDICIGFNEDETKPNKVVIGNIEQYFKSLGYKVGINKPFSNSKTLPVRGEYQTVMIEVNKRLYMNESTLEKTEGFAKLHGEIQDLYKKLLIQR